MFIFLSFLLFFSLFLFYSHFPNLIFSSPFFQSLLLLYVAFSSFILLFLFTCSPLLSFSLSVSAFPPHTLYCFISLLISTSPPTFSLPPSTSSFISLSYFLILLQQHPTTVSVILDFTQSKHSERNKRNAVTLKYSNTYTYVYN